MSQGEQPPVHAIVEEAHVTPAVSMHAIYREPVPLVPRPKWGLAEEAAAISGQNANQGSATVRHLPSQSATSFSRESHAQSVFMVTDLPSALGQRVRLRRAELDLSQIALAEKAGVGRRTIQRLETIGAVPHVTTAHKIAVALGWTLAQLERGEGAEHGNDRSEGDES